MVEYVSSLPVWAQLVLVCITASVMVPFLIVRSYTADDGSPWDRRIGYFMWAICALAVGVMTNAGWALLMLAVCAIILFIIEKRVPK